MAETTKKAAVSEAIDAQEVSDVGELSQAQLIWMGAGRFQSWAMVLPTAKWNCSTIFRTMPMGNSVHSAFSQAAMAP